MNPPNLSNNYFWSPKTIKIALPTQDGLSFEKIDDIISLEAKGNYTLIHFINNKKILVCRALGMLEEQLIKDKQFLRIHRSHTINLNYLKHYIKGKVAFAVLENGQKVTIAPSKRAVFLEALSRFFR